MGPAMAKASFAGQPLHRIYLVLQLAFKLELMWEETMQTYSWN